MFYLLFFFYALIVQNGYGDFMENRVVFFWKEDIIKIANNTVEVEKC